MIDLILGPREEPEARIIAVDLVRSAREFAQLTDQGFLSMYAGQFARAIDCLGALKEEDAAARLIALFRKYGREVQGILSQAIEQYKEAIAAGAVSPTSLLGITCGTRDGATMALDEGEGNAAPSAGSNRVYSEDPHSFEVRLAVDRERQQILIEGMRALTERTFFDLFTKLVEQNRRDAAEGRVPENYESISAPALAEELGIEESSLRQSIRRLRRRINEQLFKGSSERIHLKAVIENPSKGRGYRLNPYCWVVEPSEIDPNA